ncbi:unnamed protein product, partial [Closterium sp. NIES-53]
TSGLGLVLGGRSPVVLTGHADASWVDDLATQRSSQGYTFSLGSGSVLWRSTRSSSVLSSSCEAEIYTGAMAAQELRWLTYLLTDLGETPRSPPVLYVDNKAMLALCREHRLEHRTKHIALRYFLARELQQRGQQRLAYVASQANTVDIFTKALQPCDHQRFCTMLAFFALLCLTVHSFLFSCFTRTTLAALGFTPSTADPSLFLRTDTSLLPFYVLVDIDDLVFATSDTEALTLVKSELQKRHTCIDLGPSVLQLPILLSTAHSPVYQPLALSSTFGRVRKAEWSVLKGLVGCLMYLMTCTRPDLAYPLSLLARYVAPVRRAWGSCLEDGVQLSSLVTQRVLGSSCEAEIYVGVMAAQELRWLTYLLTDLGEQPRSRPVLYVDNKAMTALCQEHRLEHSTKHIALRYFLARELQQRGELRLAYVATRANTIDIFTKALPPGDHQRFSIMLGLLALLFLTGLVTPLFSPILPLGVCQNIIVLTFV